MKKSRYNKSQNQESKYHLENSDKSTSSKEIINLLVGLKIKSPLLQILFSISIILLLSSCFQGRPINYPLKNISTALKDRFVKDKQNFDYIAPEIEEKKDYLYMFLQHNINFYSVVKTKITVKADGKDSSQIMIKIEKLNRKWSYSLREKEMEKQFYNILLERLKSGKWSLMPWDKKYKKKEKN